MKKIFSITVLFSLLLMTYFVVTAQQDTTKVITAPTPLPSKAKILDPNNMMGKVSKSVTITSDDPTTPSLVLHFTSNVGIESLIVRFTPVEVLYDSVQVGKNDTRKILLFNTDITKVDLAFVDKPKEMVEIDLKKTNLEPGKSTEMIFRVDKKATPGYFNLCSALEINGSDKYRVTIPISGTLVAK